MVSIYHLHVDTCVNVNEQVMNSIGSKRPRDRLNQRCLWHLRLGNIKEDRINKLEKDGLFKSLTSESYPVCESYFQEKMAKLSFMRYEEKTTEKLASIHTNICGLFDVQVRDSYLYFIIFINDYSQYGYVYMMGHKSEIFEKFKEFKCEVEKQTKNFIKILQSNRGGKYLSEKF